MRELIVIGSEGQRKPPLETLTHAVIVLYRYTFKNRSRGFNENSQKYGRYMFKIIKTINKYLLKRHRNSEFVMILTATYTFGKMSVKMSRPKTLFIRTKRWSVEGGIGTNLPVKRSGYFIVSFTRKL